MKPIIFFIFAQIIVIMEWIIITGIVLILAIQFVIVLTKRKEDTEGSERLMKNIQRSFERIETNFRQDFSLNRQESRQIAKDNRDDLVQTMTEFRATVQGNIDSLNQQQQEKLALMSDKQQQLVDNTEKRLEEIRLTVDEKLQKTLNERIDKSFRLVSEHLESVQKGLGEMQTLAQDVGGLKRVLTNVKTRGTLGEIQLEMLLEQIMAPDQYEANICTNKETGAVVEFAVKLPAKDHMIEHIYLPIDAKFPKDVYEQLLNAYDSGDAQTVDVYGRLLESTVRKMAKDISQKYLDPPYTTDFAIMFLPFESIYAEIVRRSSLLEELQRRYKVIVTGPTTLAAILNSLQMGFRTLAIQKYSSEVWAVLGAVKTEFEKMGGMLEKANRNIRIAGGQIEEILGTRTRAIQRKLKEVDTLTEEEARAIIPDIGKLDEEYPLDGERKEIEVDSEI